MADARHPDSLKSEAAGIPRFLVVLTALGLGLAAGGLALLVWPQNTDNAAEPSDNVTIVNQVNQFATEYNTYDAAELEDYQRRITPLLTEAYGAETVQATNTVFEVLEPREQVSSKPQVRSIAIESRDDDSARVMVVVDATVTNTELDGEDLRQMRWILSLQNENGEWLIDGFESVPAGPSGGSDSPAEPGAGSTDPTPDPTEEGQ